MDFSKVVKTFEPSFITNPELWKISEEYTIMAALMFYYPDEFKDLEHSDSPDLHIGNSLGIEVTKCLEKGYNISIGNWTNFRMGKKGKTFEKCKKIISNQGGELTDFGIIHKVSDERTQMVPIRECINNKISKIKEYNKKYKKCYLAIMLEEPVPTVPQLAIDYFVTAQNENINQYQKLIIFCNRMIMIYDYETNTVDKKEISSDNGRYLSYIGVLIVNKLVNSIYDCFE